MSGLLTTGCRTMLSLGATRLRTARLDQDVRLQMQATKTPHRNESLSSLTRANDQVCFVLFLDSHVGPELQELAADRLADFIPTVFPDNAFAERIYVSVGRLPEFRSEQVVDFGRTKL